MLGHSVSAETEEEVLREDAVKDLRPRIAAAEGTQRKRAWMRSLQDGNEAGRETTCGTH